MKTAADHLDEAEKAIAPDYVFTAPAAKAVIAAIKAAVDEERARCAAIARRRSNVSGLHQIADIPWLIAEEIEAAVSS